MSIGLYGSIGNNMYCLAKVLRKQGYEAYYVQDLADNYPMSQPLWEDVELKLDYSRLTENVPNAAEWREIAVRYGWKRPEWVVDPWPSPQSMQRKAVRAYRMATMPVRSPQFYYRTARAVLRQQREVIQHLATYDWLIVCGTVVVSAYFSGTPYLYWPYGGDVGITPFEKATPYERWNAMVLRRAIREATIKGTHDPNFFDRLREVGVTGPIPYLPFIVDTGRYAPTHESGVGLLPEDALSRAKGKSIVLLSSRQDFYWKGSDKFIKAFVRAVRGGAALFLVISRWGADVAKTEGMIAEAGIEANVEYLDFAMSKPLLIRFYNLADIVIDQFVFPAYGTTMLEAMACGKPVMIMLDIGKFREQWPDYVEPPVINPQDEEGIYKALCDIGDGKIDLKGIGAEARKWVVKYHGIDQSYHYLLPKTAVST